MYLDSHSNSTMVFDPRPAPLHPDLIEKVDWTPFYGDMKEEIPPGAPEPRGNPVVLTTFVDSDHAGNVVARRSHTGFITYINCAPIVYHSKRQNAVESSSFGSEFIAMRTATENNRALRYKLRMFGIPIDGPTVFSGDNDSVVKSGMIPERKLNKKHNQICFHAMREAAAMGEITLRKEPTETNIADLFTKILDTPKRRKHLKNIFHKGA